jgi:hypothetical protein
VERTAHSAGSVPIPRSVPVGRRSPGALGVATTARVSVVEEAMMSIPREAFEVIIIGGGIAGDALAAVLAGAGRAVPVLEWSTVYRDQVRGELFQPWGVTEARRLGLHEVLMRASGTYHTRIVPYNETVEPAEAAAVALDTIL